MTTISNSTCSSTITLTGSTCYQSSPYTIGVGTSPTTISYSNGTSYYSPVANTSLTNNKGKAVLTIPADGDTVQIENDATLEVKGKIKVNGVDLEERLGVIEQVLNIPTRDVAMEDKHPKLKQLYEQYMRELEKYKTWDRIKGEE